MSLYPLHTVSEMVNPPLYNPHFFSLIQYPVTPALLLPLPHSTLTKPQGQRLSLSFIISLTIPQRPLKNIWSTIITNKRSVELTLTFVEHKSAPAKVLYCSLEIWMLPFILPVSTTSSEKHCPISHKVET